MDPSGTADRIHPFDVSAAQAWQYLFGIDLSGVPLELVDDFMDETTRVIAHTCYSQN
jgi:hypothetical protein